MTTYKIIRTFFRGDSTRVVKRGLTLEQAKAHVNDRETASLGAKTKQARERTRRHGPWADHYEIETPGRS